MQGKRKRKEKESVQKRRKKKRKEEEEEEEEVESRDKRVLSLYLIYNDCSDVKTRTYIGCVEDVTARLLQHNGITEANTKSTRKAQGHWKLLCILLVPPQVREEIGTKQIKILLRFGKRGVVRRIRHFVEVGKQLGLFCFLNENLLEEQNSRGWDLSDLIQEYQAQDQERQLFLDFIRKQCTPSHHPFHHYSTTTIPSYALSL